MKFTTSLWPLKPKDVVHAYECMGKQQQQKKKHVIPIILDEVAHQIRVHHFIIRISDTN